MSDIPDLTTYRRRKERKAEIEARAIRIGVSLKTINRLMAALKLMASDTYTESN